MGNSRAGDQRGSQRQPLRVLVYDALDWAAKAAMVSKCSLQKKRRTCRNHLAGAQGLAKSRASCAMPKMLDSNQGELLVGSSPPSRW
jgi:hypothetical protein